MDWYVRRFLKSSLFWLALGVTLGLVMAFFPRTVIYRPAHQHMNLLGFVAMMIFGVGYHVLPRISGRTLLSPRWAGIHWWLANLGLAGMVTGFMLRPHVGGGAAAALGIGGVLAASGAMSFVVNIWRTMDQPLPYSKSARPLPEAPARAAH